jgi:hypothetical protein
MKDAAWKTKRIEALHDLLMGILFNQADLKCDKSMDRVRRIRIACKLVAQCVDNGSLTPAEGFEVIEQAMKKVLSANELLAAGQRDEALRVIRGKSGHLIDVDPSIHGSADMYVRGETLGEEGKGMQLIEWLRAQGMTVTII